VVKAASCVVAMQVMDAFQVSIASWLNDFQRIMALKGSSLPEGYGLVCIIAVLYSLSSCQLLHKWYLFIYL